MENAAVMNGNEVINDGKAAVNIGKCSDK